MEALESWGIWLLATAFLGTLLDWPLILLGARISGFMEKPMKKAVLCAFLAAPATYILTFTLGGLPVLTPVYAYFLSLLLTLVFFFPVYKGGFGQTIQVWVFHVAAQLLATTACAVLFIGGIEDLLKIIE